MYSRVTQLEIDTVRIELYQALAVFREQVEPMLREQEVFRSPPGRESYEVLYADAPAPAL
jgi:hypothetical protein